MPTLGEFRIKNIISNDEMFRLYCESFLSCVVGKTWWNNNADKKTVSEMASISDEAFALLLLENSYMMWKGMGEDLTYKIVRDRETTVDMSKRVVPVVGTIDDSNKSTTEEQEAGMIDREGTSQEQQDDGRRRETAAETGEGIQEKGRQKQRRRRGKNEKGESTNGYANTKWTFNGPDTKKYHGWDILGMYRYKKLYRDITMMRKRSKQRQEREVAYMELRGKIASKRRKQKVTSPKELESYKQPNGFEDMIRIQGEADQTEQGELLDEEEFILSGDEYYGEDEEASEKEDGREEEGDGG
jgi:hypothetical protein